MNALTINLLLIAGTLIILAAAIAALLKHDLKKALFYDLLSQAGFIIIGIAAGNILGVIGALYHTLNLIIFSAALTLAAAAVHRQAKTFDLDKLGGLTKNMPVTFVATLIVALAVAGVPPLSGFISKWFIFQGLLFTALAGRSPMALIALTAAVLGSGLTLASFVKILHAVFLTSAKNPVGHYTETRPALLVPLATFAGLSVILGIFAFQFLFLVLPENLRSPLERGIPGFWQPVLAAFLIVIGLAAGLVIYLLFFKNAKVRRDSAFVGGENIPEDTYPTGSDFFRTLQDLFKRK